MTGPRGVPWLTWALLGLVLLVVCGGVATGITAMATRAPLW